MVREQLDRLPWAAVVGSGGLAEGVCEHLCKLGFGIILCARSEGRAYRLMVIRVLANSHMAVAHLATRLVLPCDERGRVALHKSK